MTYDPRSRGAEAYREVARELLMRNGLKPRDNAKQPGVQGGDEAPIQAGAGKSAKKKVWPF